MPLWLTETDVRALLDPVELIDAMASALAAFSAGEVVQPVRTAFDLGERSFFGVMPAFDPARGILGAKLLSVMPGNATRGVATHLAVISLFDTTSGELLAIMDGRYITEVRTAAVSALSVRHLARSVECALAILGSGVQARSHLAVLPAVRQFAEVRVWSPTPEHLSQFVSDVGPSVRAAATPEASVRGAGVILLATNSTTPAIDSRWVDRGAHVIAIGACRPTQQELDPVLIERARLFVDSRDAALSESGDIVQAVRAGRITPDHIRTELGDVAAGRTAGRTDDDEITLFKSLGLAIEDMVAARLVYQRACETGRGLRLPS